MEDKNLNIKRFITSTIIVAVLGFFFDDDFRWVILNFSEWKKLPSTNVSTFMQMYLVVGFIGSFLLDEIAEQAERIREKIRNQ